MAPRAPTVAQSREPTETTRLNDVDESQDPDKDQQHKHQDHRDPKNNPPGKKSTSSRDKDPKDSGRGGPVKRPGERQIPFSATSNIPRALADSSFDQLSLSDSRSLAPTQSHSFNTGSAQGTYTRTQQSPSTSRNTSYALSNSLPTSAGNQPPQVSSSTWRTASQNNGEGVMVYTASDSILGLETRLSVQRISDAFQWTLKRILQTARSGRDGRNPRLHGYERSKDPGRDYCAGRVIEVLLVNPNASVFDPIEPADRFTGDSRMNGQDSNVFKFRFVIVRMTQADPPKIEALRIKTYNGQGLAASGVVKSHHCIIYSSRSDTGPPHLDPSEVPQRSEKSIQPEPIRVSMLDRAERIDSKSRLDLFDRWELDGSLDCVRILGNVHENSMRPLFSQYHHVWAALANIGVGPGTIQADANGRGAYALQSPISIADLRSWYSSLRQRAAQLGFTQPRALTSQEEEYLRASHQARVDYSSRLQKGWSQEAALRRQNARDSHHDEEDDDESDSEHDDENKTDDNDDNDDNDDDDDDDDEDNNDRAKYGRNSSKRDKRR